METKNLRNGGLQTFNGGSIGTENLVINEESEALYPSGLEIVGGGQTEPPRISEFERLQKQIDQEGGLLPNFDQPFKREYAADKPSGEEPLYPAGIDPRSCFDCD